MKNIIAPIIMVIMIVCSLSFTTNAEDSYSVNRIYGKDRYETSLSIANNFESEKLKSVIIASGSNFPDALSGSVLSRKVDAPILLVGNDMVSRNEVIDFIKNKLSKDSTIYILGGEYSVDENFVESLKSIGYKNINRMGGNDRFSTNAMIIDSLDLEKNTPVVLVNGFGFADALSVSSIAASKGYPVIMCGSSQLYDETKKILKKIQPSTVYIIGGTGSIDGSMNYKIKQVLSYLNDNGIIRISGENRYDTSLNICKYFTPSSDTAIIASGRSFADALSGSALASKMNSPIILTDGIDISKQKQYFDDSEYKKLILLGGTGVIGENIENILAGKQYISDSDIKTLLNNGENTMKKVLGIKVNGNAYINIDGISYAPVEDNMDINSIYDYLNKNYKLNEYYTDNYINNFIAAAFKNVKGKVYMRYGAPEPAIIIDNSDIISKKYDTNNNINITLRGYNYDPEDVIDINITLANENGKWLIDEFNNWGIE